MMRHQRWRKRTHRGLHLENITSSTCSRKVFLKLHKVSKYAKMNWVRSWLRSQASHPWTSTDLVAHAERQVEDALDELIATRALQTEWISKFSSTPAGESHELTGNDIIIKVVYLFSRPLEKVYLVQNSTRATYWSDPLSEIFFNF